METQDNHDPELDELVEDDSIGGEDADGEEGLQQEQRRVFTDKSDPPIGALRSTSQSRSRLRATISTPIDTTSTHAGPRSGLPSTGSGRTLRLQAEAPAHLYAGDPAFSPLTRSRALDEREKVRVRAQRHRLKVGLLD